MAGEALIVGKAVVKFHNMDPDGVNAYTLLAVSPIYIVPLAPIIGEERISPPICFFHRILPVRESKA
jgi:hypothetical protein